MRSMMKLFNISVNINCKPLFPFETLVSSNRQLRFFQNFGFWHDLVINLLFERAIRKLIELFFFSILKLNLS